jgi:nucleoside-diphosphate-sugar epimerase
MIANSAARPNAEQLAAFTADTGRNDPMADTPRLFIFGLGYAATTFARAMKDRAAWIGGTVRTAEKAATLIAGGLHAVVFDGTSSGVGVKAALAEATHVLVSIPPGEGADPVLAHHAEDIVAAPRLAGVAYLSTVSVYGDYGGAWVDERTIPHPAHPRAVSRMKAEKAWSALASRRGVPLAVHRIAGIYGPGRNSLLNLAEGKAHRVVKLGQVFNRIHVADIAAVLVAALGRAGIYNLADDEPAPPEYVIVHAARLMGVRPPSAMSLEETNLSPMARSFYAGNRRVANRRIKEQLGIRLRYPTYRDGLGALWREGTWRRQ